MAQIESRGPNEYKWTVACSPVLVIGEDVIAARCESCGSRTHEYPKGVARGGLPARMGRDASGEHEHDAPLGVGWVDPLVMLDWIERHIDSTMESMRAMAKA